MNITEKKLIKDEMTNKIVDVAENIVKDLGTEALNVSLILKQLNITNRVFYNRFNNLDEVLNAIYNRIILQIRETISPEYDGKQDFFDYVMDLVTNSLILSYELKNKFNLYIFGNDSISQSNYEWYSNRINQLIQYAKEHDLIKDIDSNAVGYMIWCACRGFNADAVTRMEKEEAIRVFKNSFCYILDGIKK